MPYNNNYNNFSGYNPGYNYNQNNVLNNPGFNQPNASVIAGRYISNINEISPGDIPMDMSPAVFVQTDFQKIHVRNWDNNGNIISKTYVLSDENGNPLNNPNESQNSNNNIDIQAAMLDRLTSMQEIMLKFLNSVSINNTNGGMENNEQ